MPILVVPANNALTTDYTPRLDWSNTVYALNYQIQVSTDNTFTTTDIDQLDIVPSEFTPTSDLTSDTTYYWHVRTYNSMGQISNWSSVRAFRTALLPPSLTTPTDGENVPNKRPDFDWDDVPNATGYTIQISRNTAFTSLVGTYNVVPSNYTPAANLPANVPLYWRVRSKGVNGPSAWSAYWMVHTGNPPSIPVLIAPANNALTTDYTPLLDWNNSSLPAGTTFAYYQVQLDTDPAFSSLIIDDSGLTSITDSKFTAPVLDANTAFYWRVRAVNIVGGVENFSAWSVVRTFRTAIAPPNLLAPADSFSTTDRKPTFDWDDMDGATRCPSGRYPGECVRPGPTVRAAGPQSGVSLSRRKSNR